MAEQTQDVAYFAGGCFWCIEAEFEQQDGVSAVVSGYMGGAAETANYKAVSSGKSGHVEAVAVYYDASRIAYERLLEIYWGNIDPFDAGGQFADRGEQYQTVIFPRNSQEKVAAEASKAAVAAKFGKPVATQIRDAVPFYAAEAYHQDYHQTNSRDYERYKYGSGRMERLKTLWQE